MAQGYGLDRRHTSSRHDGYVSSMRIDKAAMLAGISNALLAADADPDVFIEKRPAEFAGN